MSLLAGASTLPAQSFPAARGMGKTGFERLVFAPELVMRHQTELGLTPEQKQALVEEMQRAQSDLVPLQLEMAEASEQLMQLMKERQIDEPTTLEVAGRVMQLEAQIKTIHLSLVIRIKNMLTDEQQAQLRKIRERQMANRRPGAAR